MAKQQGHSALVAKLNNLPVTLLICTLISFGLTVFLGISSQFAYEDQIELTANAQRFAAGSATLTDEVRAYAATADKAHYDAYQYELNTARNREIGLEKMRAIGISDAEEQMIAQMGKISNSLVPLEESALSSAGAGDREAALSAVYGPEYSRAISQISEIESRFLSAIDERSSSRVKFFTILLSVSGLLTGAFIISVIVVQFKNIRFVQGNLAVPITKIREEMEKIAEGSILRRFEMAPDESEVGQLVEAIKHTKRNLRKYVSDISETLSRMASGNLDTRITIDYVGDFEPIKSSLDGILDSLNDTIGRLAKSVNATATAVTEKAAGVLSGADELAHGAGEQAQRIEQISETVNGLATKMIDIAESARRSFASTEAAAGELAASNEQMHEMQEAMNDISVASEGIKKINDTIASIGSRTTIVALNAAIEAAKAGAVGRGFSVVADEVRNLAKLCGDASRDTNAMLASTMKAVDRGIELTHNMTLAMEKLITASRESSKDISEISTESKGQAASLQSLAQGFEQISAIVQENAATAESSADAAKELNTQAANLKKLQQVFDMFTLRK